MHLLYHNHPFKVCTSVTRLFTELCDHHHYLILECFQCPKVKPHERQKHMVMFWRWIGLAHRKDILKGVIS